MKNNLNMHTWLRRAMPRLAVMVLLLAVLGGVLTSCMSGNTKITSLKVTEITSANTTADNRLTVQQLNTLANAIAKHKQAVTIRDGLVGALNGYNTAAEGFDDSKVALPGQTMEGAIVPHPEQAALYAETVLKKYEIPSPVIAAKTAESAASADTSASADTTAPAETTEADTTYAEGSYLSVADVRTLVNSFKTPVEVNADLGVFDRVLHWIGIGFEWLINVPGFGSFILGTVYFALILEILMLPLGIRQQNNSRKQARLRPKEMAIRNKYKGRNDQATQQKCTQEIQELYTKEGYSPMAGCLPMLLTLPFLMFLYYIVLDPLTYMIGASDSLSSAFLTFANASRAAGGLGIATDSRGSIEVLSVIKEQGLSLEGLRDFQFFTNSGDCLAKLNELCDGNMTSRIPDFHLFNINMGLTPKLFQKPYILMLIPVLTFVVYWASGKITRKFTFQPMQTQGNDPAQGCSNTMMNVMMPAMSAFFTIYVPAAVGLYWMFKSILGTVKQIVLAKLMPLPVFTEEDYKAAEKELSGKDKNKPVKPSGTRNPNVRSLHHIDDDDDETTAGNDPKPLGAAKPDYKEDDEPAEPRTAEGKYGDGVTIKEDDRPTREEKPKKKKLFGKKSDEDDR